MFNKGDRNAMLTTSILMVICVIGLLVTLIVDFIISIVTFPNPSTLIVWMFALGLCSIIPIVLGLVFALLARIKSFNIFLTFALIFGFLTLLFLGIPFFIGIYELGNHDVYQPIASLWALGITGGFDLLFIFASIKAKVNLKREKKYKQLKKEDKQRKKTEKKKTK